MVSIFSLTVKSPLRPKFTSTRLARIAVRSDAMRVDSYNNATIDLSAATNIFASKLFNGIKCMISTCVL